VAFPRNGESRVIDPANQTKDRPVGGGFWIVRRELVLKLRHGLQFILGGAKHGMIGIPTFTSSGGGGGRGGSCGTGGGSRGTLWSGSRCRSIRRCGRCRRSCRGHRLVNPLQLIEGDRHVVLAHAENTAHTQNDIGHLA
jgi:hypothetical protein